MMASDFLLEKSQCFNFFLQMKCAHTIFKDAFTPSREELLNSAGRLALRELIIQMNRNKAEADNNRAQTLSHTRSHKGASPRGRSGERQYARENVDGHYKFQTIM
jgi:hypothetical protein